MEEQLDIACIKIVEPVRAKRRRVKQTAVGVAVQHLLKQNRNFPTHRDILEEAKKRADNFTVCSCYMCGNPRRNYLSGSNERMTVNERREWDDMLEQYNEYNLKFPRKRAGKVNGFR